jgi:hypothetical protein
MHNPPMFSGRGLFLVAVAAAAIGCGAATDDRPPQWSFISPAITEPSCATVNCHSAIAQRGGVDLHNREAGYDSLKNRAFVNSADPDSSPVILLMHAQGSIRMPPDQPLPEVDIQLIRTWIANGAKND